jgi:hypothetical protein
MQNPKYPLELLQRVVTVALEMMKAVNRLPTRDIKQINQIGIRFI